MLYALYYHVVPHHLVSSRDYVSALQISLGMNYLHTKARPIVHKDLKIANILVDKGLTMKVKFLCVLRKLCSTCNLEHIFLMVCCLICTAIEKKRGNVSTAEAINPWFSGTEGCPLLLIVV